MVMHFVADQAAKSGAVLLPHEPGPQNTIIPTETAKITVEAAFISGVMPRGAAQIWNGVAEGCGPSYILLLTSSRF